MTRKYKGKICVYCAELPATTSDHVFAREFFLPQDRSGLPLVPACDKCNSRKSNLEHYLTAVLPFGARHSKALDNLQTMVPKRLAKNAKLHRALGNNWGKIWAAEDGGLQVPVSTLPIDPDRVRELFSMVARGLVWYHWRIIIPRDHFVEVIFLTDHGEQFLEERFFSVTVANRVCQDLGNGTFWYEGVQAVDCPEISAWRFSIYGGLKFASTQASGELSSRIGAVIGPQSVKGNADLLRRFQIGS